MLLSLHSRRRFLKRSLKATLTVIIITPLKQLFGSFNNGIKMPSWIELIEYARWCPTIHNLQPHKIKIISETEAQLYYDPARLLPVEDPDAIFVTVAMGIFIEHLSIAASEYGKRVETIKIFSPIKTGGSEPTLFAVLKLVSSTKKEELNRELILQRRTSRTHYNGKAISSEILNKIKDEAQKFEHDFFSSSEKELVDYVIKLNQETLFSDLNSKADCEELDHLFRYTDKEAREHRDGLWAKCMGYPGWLMKSVFHHPERWHKGLKKELLAKNYKSSFRGTSTICWFGGMFTNTTDWLNAGKMLARNWLIITKENAYIQPFGSLITNAEAYKKINLKFTQPNKGKQIWMIFRAGYSKEPTRSLRLNTEEIIIQ